MTATDYLNILGYNTEDYFVATPEELKPIYDKNIPGIVNNVYSIDDPTGKKLFEKGSKIVRREWFEKHNTPVPSTPLESETKSEEPVLPKPPIEKEPEVPTVPKTEEVKPPVIDVQEEPKIEKIESEEQKPLSVLEIRLNNLRAKKGLEVDDSNEKVIFPTGDFSFKQIESYPNDVWVKILNKDYSKVQEVVEETPKVTFKITKEEKLKKYLEIGMILEGASLFTPDKVLERKLIKVNTQNDQDFEQEFAIAFGYLENNPQPSIEKEEEQIDSKITATEEKVEAEVVQKPEIIEDEKPKESEQVKEELQKPEPEEKPFVDIEEKVEQRKTQKEDVKITTFSKNGFFSQLNELAFQQLNISVNKLKNGKFSLVVKPNNFSDDPAYDNLRPLTVSGTPEELDKEFINAIQKPLEVVNGLMLDAESYLKELKEAEKKTKAAEALKKKIDKAVTDAEKYQKDKFDAEKKSSVTTATKKWNEVLELDSENKKAKEALKDIQTKTGQETLI